jgi:hypothetical protein
VIEPKIKSNGSTFPTLKLSTVVIPVGGQEEECVEGINQSLCETTPKTVPKPKRAEGT